MSLLLSLTTDYPRMPYSPTQAFPHPLANIQSSNADTNMTNYLSYTMVEAMTWQGLGDVINRFRANSLGLEPISLMWAPGMLARLRVPYTYCFSPSLVPKPKDWGNNISLSGFYFLSLASNFTPDPELKAFLDAGPPPVYIGFGSIVVDDPTAMTKMIFEAVKKTGQRALVSKGWGGIGADELGIPEGVMMLGNVPHDWLFKHVSCVVHHGGAGTTAAGISLGKPTVIVPFFGDQGWWAAMVAKAGAGPEPVRYKNLDADKLAANITSALSPESKERAQELANNIAHEKGTESGCQSFHQFLEVDKLRCTIAPSRAAVWRLKRTNVRFSALAATVLGNEGLLDFKDLKLYRAREYETEDGPWDPITGGGAAIVSTASSVMMGVADFPVEALKALKIHPDSRKKKKVSQDKGDQSSESQATSDSQSSIDSMSVDQRSFDDAESIPGATSPQSASGFQFNLSESLARLDSGRSSSPSETQSQHKGNDLRSLGSGLREQLNDQIGRKRSASGSRSLETSGSKSPTDKFSASSQPPDVLASALDTGKGVSRIAGSLTRSPMDFTLALSKGFRNVPKLYGDDTVRKTEPVTDFKSGLKTATKEFGLGMFDGITGLVTQPIQGAKKEGAAGFLKGVGKGFGGIVFKPGAAFFGIPGYMMKGIYQELQAINGSSILNYIIAARTAQGYADWHNSHPQERADIVERWSSLQGEIKKKKNPDEALYAWASEQQRKRVAWQSEQKQKIKDQLKSPSFRNMLRRDKSDVGGQDASSSSAGDSQSIRSVAGSLSTADSRMTPASTQSSEQHSSAEARPQTNASTEDDAELDEAIRQSVAASSAGNTEEDAIVERALQASIRELRSQAPPQYHEVAGGQADDEESEAIRDAMAASIIEAERHSSRTHHEDTSEADMEAAIKASLEHERKDKARQFNASESQTHASSAGGDQGGDWNDEDLTSAIRISKHPAMRSVFDVNASAQAAGDEHILKETKERGESGHKGAVTKDEEMEHELEQIRQAELQSGTGDGGASDGKGTEDEDEEMAKALRESLAAHKDEQGRIDEEKVVLEYIKRQSKMEEEHRRAVLERGGATGNKGKDKGVDFKGGRHSAVEAGSSSSAAASGGDGDDDGDEDNDEELKRAIEMSKNHQRGA